MAVFDATALVLFLEPDARPPTDPATSRPVANANRRVAHLIESLANARETIIVPAPALAEVLVHAKGAAAAYLGILNDKACFRIVLFDERAAVEHAAITWDALTAGDLRAGTDATRAALKFDRQIIAIARVEGQREIYSDDDDMARLGERLGLTVIRTCDLPPPPPEQAGLEFPKDPT